ncbi:thiamine pyrophosphate-dependent enzyme [Candidatus Arthromitus sp. SFB-rat-Yit]|uniref:thiamine pyrophosphate-dependent enzyme n=1 Tax=Candidatus Arthromitus sp. SFB-rat-Yit TaxID=1041504 RepID=UPI000227A780|nr:thiamine pyrophosphate-dependent enzyme [Candidatus Arthromitus sp. SFB-rat-Yit]BAK81740.1 thiamine pyrophosphate protein domain protein TPP-binding [Candidatus Arthromitus sp. SFB-rat-Yit]
MSIKFEPSKGIVDVKSHYCPGCTHGIINNIIAEVLVELDILDISIGIASVGCSVFIYEYIDCDFISAAHGRAPSVATSVSRLLKDRVVFTYQGDGDLAAIGTSEIIHAALRGENIVVIFINNGTYGMTGGQMAPTTLNGQVTETSPKGKNKDSYGAPIKICELLETIEGVRYLERVSTHNLKGVMNTKKSIKKAFEYVKNGEGFCLIEILSTCPTNWGKNAVDSLKWVEENMSEEFKLKKFKE